MLMMRWARIRGLIGALAGIALAAAAPAETLCPGQNVAPMPDGRMLGHIPYAEASPDMLVPAPAGFGLGNPCYVHRDMAYDLGQMLTAAQSTPGIGNALHAVSCFRSIERQRAIFCSQIGPHKRCANAAERARTVGPPGYSEHATGYAIDFAARPSPGCGDVSACFARTPAGRWLILHAPDYGFELSFPPGNGQGVTWEPWHWRWVGVSALRPGALAARGLFARARSDFPAYPTTRDGTSFPLTPPDPSLPPPGAPFMPRVPLAPGQPPMLAPAQPGGAPNMPAAPGGTTAPTPPSSSSPERPAPPVAGPPAR